MTIEIGDKVPHFSGETVEGTWSLNDFTGKKVVVYFYPRDNTPGCTTEANAFNEAMSELASSNAVVVGISTDDLASHQKFIDKYDLQFPLIADTDHAICELFGVYQEKKFMGKTFMGVVRSTFLIDEQGILQKAWRKVKVKGHVDEVLASL